MAVASIPAGLLGPRLAALAEHLPGALEGAVQPVHQARVASRRLREALPVFGTLAGRRHLRQAIRRVRHVTRALGPVRELDVALALLDDTANAHSSLDRAVRLVRRIVATERRRRRHTLLEAIDKNEAARTVASVQAVLQRVETQPDDGAWRTELSSRMINGADQLIERIYDVGLLFDPVRLHEVRIAAKKLRYAAEIAGETHFAPTGPFVKTLKRSQDELGRLHDLQILLLFARAPTIGASVRYREPLGRLRDYLERECHREHARYLRRRVRLFAVCEAVSAMLRVRTATRTPRRIDGGALADLSTREVSHG